MPSKLKFDAQCMRELADEPTAEQQHAYDEDHALDDKDPLTDGGEIVLQSDHEECPCHWPEQGAEPADQGHEDDLSRHWPINVGQGCKLKHQRLRGSCDPGKRCREHEGE